jgi:CheY-like chemotaxis protein
MVFAAKVRGTGDATGVNVELVKSLPAALAAARAEIPALIVCDVHAEKFDPMELARQLKADEALRGIPLVGFFSHVNIDLKRQAEEAGFDRVLPRSLFVKKLGEILAGTA